MALNSIFEKKYFWCPLLLLVIGSVLIFKTYNEPIRDFGNYYYASKLLADDRFSPKVYEDIQYFNSEIASYGEKDFFENYAPVPPFSLVFYLPFVLMKAATAKLVFNILGLILLCFSLYRLIKTFEVDSIAVLLIPLVFIIPLYQNIYQGQFYLFALSLLVETFLLLRKDKWLPASLLFALLISVKLFPILFLIYFIVKRKFRFVLASLLLMLFFHLLLLAFIDADVLYKYAFETLPRLLQNDIIGCYHATNQSFYSVLLNLFSGDELWNKNPAIDLPYLVPVLEALITAVVLAFYFNANKKNESGFFALTIFIVVLIGRYNASYAALMLLPVFLYIAKEFPNKVILLFTFALAAFAFWIPVNALNDSFVFMKFLRIILLSLIFIIVLIQLRIKFSVIYFSVFFIVLLGLKLFTFKVEKVDYFSIQNSKGVLYDMQCANDSLILYSCMGDKIITEKFPLPGKVEVIDVKSILSDKAKRGENISKGFRYNDSVVVYMSDKMQAIRMYKLQQMRIK